MVLPIAGFYMFISQILNYNRQILSKSLVYKTN